MTNTKFGSSLLIIKNDLIVGGGGFESWMFLLETLGNAINTV